MNFLYSPIIFRLITAILFLILLILTATEPAFANESVYKEARKLLDNMHTEEAYDLMWQTVMNDPTNIKANFLLAKAAMKLKRYENAAAAYKRILIVKPGRAKARLNLGIAYYRLGSYNLAEKNFSQVLVANPGPKIQESAKKYLTEITKQKNPHQWQVSVAGGRVYNTNVNTGPGDDLIETLDGTARLKAGETSQTDWGTIADLRIRYTWDTGIRGGFLWLNKAVMNNYFYDHEYRHNLSVVSLESGPVYIERENYRIDMPVTYDFVEYGSDFYSRVYGVKPRIDLLHSPNLLTRLSIKWQYQDYEDDRRDGAYFYLGAMPRIFWNSKKFMFQWSVGYEWKWAKKDIKAFEGLRTKMLLQFKINKWIKNHLFLEYKKSRYDERDPLYIFARENDKYKAGLKFYITLPWQNLRTILSFDYTKNDSNIESYEYKRKRTIIKLEKKF